MADCRYQIADALVLCGGIDMTYEDVKRIRENPQSADCDNRELSKLIDRAVEKQIPKPIPGKYAGRCGCSNVVFAGEFYCSKCGQKIRLGGK